MDQKAGEIAVFGAGCFWGVEESFRTLEGVISTRVGYAGGNQKNPTYEQVCTDQTGHAEVVEVVFDPEILPYDLLLEAFWQIHDPTQLNRQGPDFGSQYRSAIFTTSENQAKIAEASKAKFSPHFKNEIVTLIEPLGQFWEAEEYHQKYLMKRGLGVCH